MLWVWTMVCYTPVDNQPGNGSDARRPASRPSGVAAEENLLEKEITWPTAHVTYPPKHPSSLVCPLDDRYSPCPKV